MKPFNDGRENEANSGETEGTQKAKPPTWRDTEETEETQVELASYKHR